MKASPNEAAVLWTGGKDSSLALYETMLLSCRNVRLVTFAPRDARFLAHPLKIMKYQAEALHLPHEVLEVGEPFEKSYRSAIACLNRTRGVSAVVTGDITEVDGIPNWMEQCCDGLGIRVLKPLWGRSREQLLGTFVSAGFKAVFSCVKKPWFTEQWLGAELDRACIERLRELKRSSGIDICGENGEYHTLVLDGPLFRKRLELTAFRRRTDADVMYLDIEEARLLEKSPAG